MYCMYTVICILSISGFTARLIIRSDIHSFVFFTLLSCGRSQDESETFISVETKTALEYYSSRFHTTSLINSWQWKLAKKCHQQRRDGGELQSRKHECKWWRTLKWALRMFYDRGTTSQIKCNFFDTISFKQKNVKNEESEERKVVHRGVYMCCVVSVC